MGPLQALDGRFPAPLLRRGSLRGVPRDELLRDVTHLRGKFLHSANWFYFSTFFYLQLDYHEGVPRRLDRQLRKLEAAHDKNVALVHELNGLPSLAAPG